MVLANVMLRRRSPSARGAAAGRARDDGACNAAMHQRQQTRLCPRTGCCAQPRPPRAFGRRICLGRGSLRGCTSCPCGGGGGGGGGGSGGAAGAGSASCCSGREYAPAEEAAEATAVAKAAATATAAGQRRLLRLQKLVFQRACTTAASVVGVPAAWHRLHRASTVRASRIHGRCRQPSGRMAAKVDRCVTVARI